LARPLAWVLRSWVGWRGILPSVIATRPKVPSMNALGLSLRVVTLGATLQLLSWLLPHETSARFLSSSACSSPRRPLLASPPSSAPGCRVRTPFPPWRHLPRRPRCHGCSNPGEVSADHAAGPCHAPALARDTDQRAGPERPVDAARPHVPKASSTVGKGCFILEGGYTVTTHWGPGTTIRSQTYPEALLRYGLTEGLEMRVGQNTSTQQTVGVESPAPLRGAQDQELGVKLALATPHTLRGKSSCGSWPRASTAWRLQFGVSSQKAIVWKGV
jgi:hypothetical protein